MDKDTPELLPCLSDGEIMEIINECFPWQTEAKINDLLTREKSAPLIPQATYDVPSYRAERFVRAIEKRIRATSPTVPIEPTEGVVKPLEWDPIRGEGVETYQAKCSFGMYRIFSDEDSAMGAIFVEFAVHEDRFCMKDAISIGRVHDWSAAENAAQQHFNNAVASCLTTPPSTDVEGLRAEAQFLIDRLEDFERGGMSDDIEDAVREFEGHVSPAIARLRDCLSRRPSTDAEAENKRLREALEWYGEQTRLARLNHSEGDAGRHALAADGGKIARQALAEQGEA
ncbi:hypothetical protein [Devosia pacifica]|nr:hypothetical protein [Devosia pacifica]